MEEKKTKLQRQARQLDLQLPLYAASLHFFTMFSAGIRSGDLIPKLGAPAFTVYVALRAHADFETGRVYLSLADLQRVTGMALMTIRRAIKKLEDENLLRVVQEESAKRRRYFVVDIVSYTDTGTDPQAAVRGLLDGVADPVGELAVTYVPAQVAKNRQAIQRFLEDGTLTSPHVQLVGQQVINQQVVGQQLVVNQTVQIHLHGGEQPAANAPPAPFIGQTLARVAETLKRRENSEDNEPPATS